MDKLFEHAIKYLPSDIVPVALAAAAAFFGIYYYRPLHSYTDVLRDPYFQSALVVIVAGSLLYHFNKTKEPRFSAADSAPLLLVPEFKDDERGQFKTLFIQQVGSAIQAATKRDKSILILNSFLLDENAARVTGKHYQATAVIYDPKIVRVAEKVFICFNLLHVDPDLTKPYPPSAVELDKQILNDITQTLVIANSAVQAKLGDPLSRFEILEKRVTDLEGALTKLSTPAKSSVAGVTYKHKRAIVVGVDKHSAGKLPNLQYAVSDAKRIASLLASYDFEVTLLENATSLAIEEAIDREAPKVGFDDLFLFYFSGNGVRSTDLKVPGELSLFIGTSDLSLQQPKANLTLSKIVERLKATSARHKLLILDACYGTAGLRTIDISDPTVQIFSGSQDDQFAGEGPEFGGGVFTNALVETLKKNDGRTSIAMERLAKEVAGQMALSGASRQQPTLVGASGVDQIVWSRGSSASKGPIR